MPPRTRTTTAVPAPAPDTGFTPIRITPADQDRPADSVPLFYLGDEEFRIPRKVPRTMVLEFMRLQRAEGELGAAQRILERLLGPTAYLALEQSDDVTEDHLEQILRAVVHHIAGPPESGKD
ncbi:hypothetical protein [Kitasatospora camelliae]|uniref:Tail assembly chaperone n=1 Tax=Kitasatospora camelliae TaxID=3156397 RepID=A0AAU8K2H7_9ACTN